MRCVPAPVVIGWGTPWLVSYGRPGGHGDVLRGSRGDAAGAKPGTSCVERSNGERGKRPASLRSRAAGVGVGAGAPSAEGVGRGGAAVVVVGVTPHRGGRESRSQGEVAPSNSAL